MLYLLVVKFSINLLQFVSIMLQFYKIILNFTAEHQDQTLNVEKSK